ncbi:MAG: phosphoribosylformylglycinamidine cyclo-ligase [Candidatus Omnitrophica bacterium]|nr:phosphoribosylformylglycinamidine cyclo-ligase [Candidatus Omnitrophota bacterium]
MAVKLTYKKSGVDVKKADLFVQGIRSVIATTPQRGVLRDVGCFASLYDAGLSRYRNPILVSSTDGVGTKIKIARLLNCYSTIGIDLVAMNVNDIITVGARPLFFLDYIATGRVRPRQLTDIVRGIAAGCIEADCALLGGETAEMPGIYQKGDFDLAGFCVGVCEKRQLLSPEKMRPGDRIIGVASSGVHSNGFSLVRRIFSEGSLRKDKHLAKELLTPTRIYVKCVERVMAQCRLHAVIHVTGGGFHRRIVTFLNRVLGKRGRAEVDVKAWPAPEIFRVIQKKGGISTREMFHTFNMGVGLVLVCARQDTDRALNAVQQSGFDAWVIGRITK